MKWLGPVLATVMLGGALTFAACGGDDPPGAGTGGGDAGGDNTFIGPTCDLRCSSDLHEVLDCDNKVVKRCPEGEGCSPGGSCVAACDSARNNKSTLGCEYWVPTPAANGETDGSCFAAFVANTWTTPINIAVTYKGQPLDVSTFGRVPVGSGPSISYQPLAGGVLPPQQVAILFLADFNEQGMTYQTRCPAGVTAAVTASPVYSRDPAVLDAFSITSTAPVVAYDMYPYGGALSYVSSATLLVPSSAWGDNYIGVIGYPRGGGAGPFAQPFLQLVGSADGTEVTVRPPNVVTLAGAGAVPPGPGPGQPQKYTLNKGQVVQLKQNDDLTGAVVQANKPVGVFGGSSCMYIEPNENACDSGHQQLVPARALGNKYVGVKYKDRLGGVEEAPPWRLVGVVDGTVLTYEPAPPVGAPTTLQSGEVRTFRGSGPFVVKSQDGAHPFYVAAHMTGQKSSGKDFLIGDPEFVNVVPTEQWLRSYVVMTDPTMGFTNLVVTRGKGPAGFADVELDCLGKVLSWQNIGTTGEYQMARIDLVIDGKPAGNCNNGRHSMKSDQPFGLTVWGLDTTVSYAYPAGASVKPINEVIVPAVK